MSKLYGMPGHLIRRVHQISTAIFAEECAGHGLTSVQYAALTAIQENPDTDATRLSSLIAFDRSTLGDVLERLEARGYIIRTPSSYDKRTKILTLSQAGHDVLATIEPAVRRVQQRLLAPLEAKDGLRIAALLTELIDAHGGNLGDPSTNGVEASAGGQPGLGDVAGKHASSSPETCRVLS
jgi:DNA-binding MarR family transcriptional regulator